MRSLFGPATLCGQKGVTWGIVVTLVGRRILHGFSVFWVLVLRPGVQSLDGIIAVKKFEFEMGCQA